MAKTQPSYYGMNVRKKKDGTIISTDTGFVGNVPKKTRAISSGPVSAPAGSAKPAYGQVNTSGNARQGQKFQTEFRKGGVVHAYADGQRVFVKKPKKARSLHVEPPVTDANSRATPSGNAGYGIYHKKPRKSRGRLVPPRTSAHGHPPTSRDQIGYA